MGASLALGQGRLDAFPTHQKKDDGHTVPLLPSLETYAAAVVVIFFVHSAMSCVSALAIPRMGLALVTYTSLLVTIALVIIGLARWGALV